MYSDHGNMVQAMDLKKSHEGHIEWLARTIYTHDKKQHS